MFQRTVVAALVAGAALALLPVGAFAQDRDDYRFQAPYGDRWNDRHEYREQVREWDHAREWREIRRRENARYERARREDRRDYRYAEARRDWR